MSKSTFVRPPRHTLVQQRDDRGRLSSLHAAIPALAADVVSLGELRVAWRTACGTILTSTPASPVRSWTGEDAHEQLEAPGAKHCARCTRVGDAVADQLALEATS